MSVPAKETAPPGTTARRTITQRALDVGVLDRHHGVGAARQHPAGGDRDGGARAHLGRRRDAGRDRLRAEREPDRRRLAGAEGVRRAHREAVHVRAVEAGDVDLGDARPRASTRPSACASGTRLGGERRDVDRRAPAALGLVAIQHLEELALPHAAAPASAPAGSSS